MEKYQFDVQVAFIKADFPKRYKDVSLRFSESNFDLLQKKNDKKNILSIFQELGYSAKYSGLEQDYVINVEEGRYTFRLNFNLKHGVVVNYFTVFVEGNRLILIVSGDSYTDV